MTDAAKKHMQSDNPPINRFGVLEFAFEVASQSPTAASGPIGTPDRLLTAIKAELLEELDSVMTWAADNSAHIQIDQLQLDLGAFPDPPDWDTVRLRLRETLMSALGPYLRLDQPDQAARSHGRDAMPALRQPTSKEIRTLRQSLTGTGTPTAAALKRALKTSDAKTLQRLARQLRIATEVAIDGDRLKPPSKASLRSKIHNALMEYHRTNDNGNFVNELASITPVVDQIEITSLINNLTGTDNPKPTEIHKALQALTSDYLQQIAATLNIRPKHDAMAKDHPQALRDALFAHLTSRQQNKPDGAVVTSAQIIAAGSRGALCKILTGQSNPGAKQLIHAIKGLSPAATSTLIAQFDLATQSDKPIVKMTKKIAMRIAKQLTAPDPSPTHRPLSQTQIRNLKNALEHFTNVKSVSMARLRHITQETAAPQNNAAPTPSMITQWSKDKPHQTRLLLSLMRNADIKKLIDTLVPANATQLKDTIASLATTADPAAATQTIANALLHQEPLDIGVARMATRQGINGPEHALANLFMALGDNIFTATTTALALTGQSKGPASRDDPAQTTTPAPAGLGSATPNSDHNDHDAPATSENKAKTAYERAAETIDDDGQAPPKTRSNEGNGTQTQSPTGAPRNDAIAKQSDTQTPDATQIKPSTHTGHQARRHEASRRENPTNAGDGNEDKSARQSPEKKEIIDPTLDHRPPDSARPNTTNIPTTETETPQRNTTASDDGGVARESTSEPRDADIAKTDPASPIIDPPHAPTTAGDTSAAHQGPAITTQAKPPTEPSNPTASPPTQKEKLTNTPQHPASEKDETHSDDPRFAQRTQDAEGDFAIKSTGNQIPLNRDEINAEPRSQSTPNDKRPTADRAHPRAMDHENEAAPSSRSNNAAPKASQKAEQHDGRATEGSKTPPASAQISTKDRPDPDHVVAEDRLTSVFNGLVQHTDDTVLSLLELIWSAIDAPKHITPNDRAAFWKGALSGALANDGQSNLAQYVQQFITTLLPDPESRTQPLRTAIARLGYASGSMPASGRHQARAILQDMLDVTSTPAPFTPDDHTQTPTPREPDAGIRLQTIHAGLVLFRPYLAMLFDRLEITHTKKGIAADDLSLASGCLNRLALGDTPYDLPPDPLHKILLGMPQHAPLPDAEPLDQAGRALIDSLIQSVITQWARLGSTSPDGLRAAFIQRDGVIDWGEEGQPKLTVSQGPYDMLLDSLPWSINIVALPWMPAPLMVDWRNSND